MLENLTAVVDAKSASQGWTTSPNGRGTWDILTSCCFTIILCCWTSVCPNIPAKTDSTWWKFRDKLRLALLGILGPDFLMMLALGQWSSARRSVKLFHTAGYANWTMTHAFFADMGGFLLQTVEGPEFPIDAEQLYFHVSKEFIQFPSMDKKEIDDRNKADGLARFVTICQVIWFTVNSISRPIQHLNLTTIELTTLSFILIFFVVSFCWHHKPMDVSSTLVLKANVELKTILHAADHVTQHPWERTPLDFISRKEYFCSVFWRYYTQILFNVHVPIFTAPTIPYVRIPSDNFPSLDRNAEILTGPFILMFGGTFLCAWTFSFPSWTEQLLWRIAASFNVGYAIIGGSYAALCEKVLLPNQWKRGPKELPASVYKSRPRRGLRGRLHKMAAQMRNNNPHQDPNLEIPLKALFPVTILCVCYVLCRAFILVEDIIGLRSLPASSFETVDWSGYMPHL